MEKRKYLLLILINILIIKNINSEERELLYKCLVDKYKIIPKVAKNSIPIDYNNPLYKRRLDNIDPDGFKKFNIYLDLENIKYEVELYNLTEYYDVYINSMKKAIETFQSLLKVKAITLNYQFSDDDLKALNIIKWNSSNFGSEAFSQKKGLLSLGIDLAIFGRFEDLGTETLATAGARYMHTNGQPLIGIVNINLNKSINYSKSKSQEYFQSIILHEFTHILGFSEYFFIEYFHNIFNKSDNIGINRYYINSTKVIEVAKKYFNCSDIDGVELEEFGGSGTVGSHWEARILLGDYMNGVIYPEEQVISEFTLALLEDSGYYKPNYYTGGLMRYGKNKGCSFVRDRCINESHEINPLFENEFYDSIKSYHLIDASCSSGRQSRTYHAWWLWGYIPEYYQYFEDKRYGGWPSADFCPVSQSHFSENENGYCIGHCSKKGSGEYGSQITYEVSNGVLTYNKSEELYSITGEEYSDHSYCFLSSLTKKNVENIEYYSNTVRAICYESFCSPRSLTIKIHDDYIVCPRAGGKIEVEGYEGYFLCPDYNLMCSGTVLCNDMFDCVEKKSEIKNESYFYDYEIKTSQNIEAADIEDADDINNYELTENGTCPIFCKHCKEKNCVKCRNNYDLVALDNDEEKLICMSKDELNIGYYKNNSIYYKCIDNCEICSNKTNCDKCKNNLVFFDNKCIEGTKNCKEYDSDKKCIKCNDNFAFKEDDKNNCLSIENFTNYYSKDEGTSYYPCDGEGQEHIKNCEKCYYDKNINKLKCYECKNNYILIDEELDTCYEKQSIDNNKSFYYINNTYAKKCSSSIENCNECRSDKICTKCIIDFYLINNDTKQCKSKNTLNNIEEYYLNEENTTYYSCNNINYNSIRNCKKCLSKDDCLLCQNDFTFIDGNKTFCIEKEIIKNKYILDPNDFSNYIKCSNFIKNCNLCNNSQCFLCNDGYVFINDNLTNCILKSSLNIDLYFTYNNIMFYSCEEEQYKNNIKCKKFPNSTFLKFESTNPQENEVSILKTYPNSFNSISSLINNASIIKGLISSVIEQKQSIANSTFPKTIPNINNKSIQNTVPEKTDINSILNINQTISLSVPTKLNKSTLISYFIDNKSSIYQTQNINIDSVIKKTTTTENNPEKSNLISTLSNSDSINTVPNTNLNSQILTTLSNKNDSINIISNNTIIKSQIINSNIERNDNITNITSTLINNKSIHEEPKIINTIFILQVQLINNTLIMYILSDFPIPKNYSILLSIKVSYKNSRNLQQNEGEDISVRVYAKENNDKDKIVAFSSDEEFNKEKNIKKVEVQTIELDKNIENNDININILDNNKDCLDTEKVENKIKNEGGLDYSTILSYSNYPINQYKINSATKGCDFNLESNSAINEKDKQINLNFKNDNSTVTANCSLSQNNENPKSIPCSLDKDIDSNYYLEDFIESDEKGTFSILQSDKSNKLYLNCFLSSKKPKGSSGLKTGALIGLIIFIVFLASGFIIAIILSICKSKKYLEHTNGYSIQKNSIVSSNSDRKF